MLLRRSRIMYMRYVDLAQSRYQVWFIFFFFNDTATTEIYTLSLHDALPILRDRAEAAGAAADVQEAPPAHRTAEDPFEPFEAPALVRLVRQTDLDEVPPSRDGQRVTVVVDVVRLQPPAKLCSVGHAVSAEA